MKRIERDPPEDLAPGRSAVEVVIARWRHPAQVVGGRNDNHINEFLEAPVNEAFAHWNLDFAAEELRQANFQVVNAREEYPVTRFYDVGALVYCLRMVEWQVPGFTVERYAQKLRELHHFIIANGCFEAPSHRFLIKAASRAVSAVRITS